MGTVVLGMEVWKWLLAIGGGLLVLFGDRLGSLGPVLKGIFKPQPAPAPDDTMTTIAAFQHLMKCLKENDDAECKEAASALAKGFVHLMEHVGEDSS